MTVAYSLEGCDNPPRGVRGGRAGAPTAVWKHEADGTQAEVPRVAAVELAPWERIVSVTSGGGGYGHPAERDPALVLDDVLEGWVSRERAESEYGVVLRAGAAEGRARDRRGGDRRAPRAARGMTAAPASIPRTELGTLPDALARWARVQPQAPALAQGGEQLTYRELAAVVEDLAGRLGQAGVVPGERVALVGENTVEWAACFLAALRLGAVVVPLNRRLSPLELGRQIDLCRPRIVAAGEAERGTLERAGATGSYPTLALERDAEAESVWRLPRGEVDARVSGPDAALISFTSGTTGAPKGAVITHDALVRSASSFVPHLETSEADSTLVLVPLFHNTGFADQLTQMLLVGGAVDLLREFETAAALDALAARPASYLIAVPSIFRLLMLHEHADDAFRHCRVAVYGGAPMPTPWIEELARRWPSLRLFNCYGLTEFTSVSHLLAPGACTDARRLRRAPGRRRSPPDRGRATVERCQPAGPARSSWPGRRECRATGRRRPRRRRSFAASGCGPATWVRSMPTTSSCCAAAPRT